MELFSLLFYFTLILHCVNAKVRHPGSEEDGDDCEAVCPTCPAKDSSLFDSFGLLKAKDLYGTWVYSTTCMKNYLFSSCGLNWFEAHDKCCKLGMRLVSLPTNETKTCMANANSIAQGEWWTSGTDEGCTYKTRQIFSWCSTTKIPFNDAHNSNKDEWEKKEPNNAKDSEKCVKIRKENSKYLMSDKSCYNMYKYICVGPKPPNPVCGSYTDVTCPICPAKDPLLLENDGVTIKNPSQYGDLVVTPCGKLLVSTITLKKTDAHTLCCKLGMKLVSIVSTAVKNCVSTAIGGAVNTQFFTSATVENCQFVPPNYPYRWCNGGSNPEVITGAGTLWNTGEPNNYNNVENCAVAVQRPTSFILNDENCNNAKRFICE